MDFAFSEEQDALRSSAREFLSKRYPIEHVAALVDGEGFPRREWREVVELGWAGISVPEDQGGAGLSFLEELIVAEEAGRALYPGPYLSVTMAQAGLRAASARHLAAAVAAGERIATVGWAGEDGRFDSDPAPKIAHEGERLSGTRLFVPDLGVSDLLVIVGSTEEGPGLWAVDRDAEGVEWRELPTVDGTRRLGEVILHSAPAVALPIEGPADLERIRDRALAGLGAEAVGLASRVLELALEHARTRRQFGRPIGAFQAVSHQLAQAFMEVETARSLVYWAGWAVAQSEPEAMVAAALAKQRAAEAAVAACERAIQAHGGVGFTWEHPLHRFYKRALGISFTMGTGAELRATVAAALLD
jgi:alkylation response protein AidB-like acyl-CoA dehydrogenase